MSLRISLLLSLAAAPLAAATPAMVQPGVQKFYKDWGVACDNSLSCEAVALEPESFPNGGMSLVLSRNSVDGKVQIAFSGVETTSDRYRIFIDGRAADSGPVGKDGTAPITVTGVEALRLARAISRGNALLLDDGKGNELGKASLAGSAAALRYIDAIQNRAGTATALAATGRKALRPKSAPLPEIIAKRIHPGEKTPDAAALISLTENSPCTDERYGVTEDTAYSLGTADGQAMALVMLSCGSGAYNFSHAPYVGRQEASGKWSFTPARFDYGGDMQTGDGAVQLLVNADWDAGSQSLSSHAKGRGVGDCGRAESYVWDGTMFRLTAAYGMEECRGSMDWMTLWRATVRFTD